MRVRLPALIFAVNNIERPSLNIYLIVLDNNFKNLYDVIEGNVLLALQLGSDLVGLSLEENISGW